MEFFKVEQMATGSMSPKLQKQVKKVTPDFVDALGSRFVLIDEVIAAADNSGDEELQDEAKRFYDDMYGKIGKEMEGKSIYVRLDK